MESVSDPVALVTGASGGLGGAMAVALLSVGYRVVLSGTKGAVPGELVGKDAASRWSSVAADLSEADAAERLAQDATSAFGRVDILINNAGISTSAIESPALDLPVSFRSVPNVMIERFYRVNVLAPLRLAALLAPAMAERGWGRIINVTTGLGTMLAYSGYGGSKAALEAETACMAKDLAETGVTANTLLPGGPTATRMTARFSLPSSKMLQPDIVAGPTLYLASSESNGVTGRRFIAALWNPDLPAKQAARQASAPVAWTDLATPPIRPQRR